MEGIRGSLCCVTRVNEADSLKCQRQITALNSRDLNRLAQPYSVPLLQVINYRNEPIDG